MVRKLQLLTGVSNRDEMQYGGLLKLFCPQLIYWHDRVRYNTDHIPNIRFPTSSRLVFI